ncbi:efflux transporter periplasmic adaptor subunit [Photobacterium jeanii]|uniref:Efflux transporter periplasmic adaptor subunit n=1 Tax=Photobacterium jeanii TaxID=858640 RepID=A0A178K856_9GAMM|nr:efflux RND transporter periplasmic adaptor subunit [Photobacterium jeanii]OAN13519.1 efflux transporter periplasmic adaptor subunit [Photobacterium jeanii]PST88634.1 efflux RND transporter periplasmic adaptor subunit [Photobacterium jeanii]
MKKIIVAAAVALALAGGSQFVFNGESQAAEKSAKKMAAQRSIAVTTGIVASEPVAQSLSLVGKLESQRSVMLAAEVSAKVNDIAVGVNSQVKKGDLLIQLDDAKSRASYNEAKAYLADEKRKYTEFERLVKRGALTQTELNAQLASVQIAQARLDAAKAELNDHAIRAPFAGTVGLIDFSQGHLVTSGSELFSLDDLAKMRLDIQVPEQYLSYLRQGMKVQANSQAWSTRVFEGEIVAIDSRVQQDTLNIRVRVNFDNQDKKLKPGMLMTANLHFVPQDAAIIPVQALEYSGSKRFVYVVDEAGIAHRTQVQLGARIENEVVIQSGVMIGDRIVVQGLVNMRDGAKVNDLTAKQAEPKKTKAEAGA